jgi:prepilin-type N-terminal cleavage/methylation domain-containing protein
MGDRATFSKGSCSQQGFSLIEMLVAMVILSISMLALTALTITAMKTNMRTDLRNTAVRLCDEKAEEFTAAPIDSIVTAKETRSVSLRNGAVSKNFDIEWTVTPQGSNLKQIEIAVECDNKVYQRTVVFKHRSS